MPRIYLVRHGKATGSWGAEWDPGLDDRGRSQADAAARALSPLGPLTIISSPLVRARETAAPLAKIWGCAPRVEERVGEIPSPTKDLALRLKWLRGLAGKIWPHLEEDLQGWRRGVVEALRGLDLDAVVFTHTMAINASVGEATGDDRVVCFWPANGSITIVDVDGGRLRLIKRGEEALASRDRGPEVL